MLPDAGKKLEKGDEVSLIVNQSDIAALAQRFEPGKD